MEGDLESSSIFSNGHSLDIKYCSHWSEILVQPDCNSIWNRWSSRNANDDLRMKWICSRQSLKHTHTQRKRERVSTFNDESFQNSQSKKKKKTCDGLFALVALFGEHQFVALGTIRQIVLWSELDGGQLLLAIVTHEAMLVPRLTFVGDAASTNDLHQSINQSIKGINQRRSIKEDQSKKISQGRC